MQKETAEDICSQTFLAAYEYIEKKNPDIKSFKNWIYKIATNEIYSHHRKKKNKTFCSMNDENLNLAEYIADNKNVSMENYADFLSLREVLKRLKKEDHLLIELFYFEKMKYTEISKIMKVKEVTLRSRISRILKKLEGSLEC